MKPMAYRVVARKSEKRLLILQLALFLAIVFLAVIVVSFVGVTVVPSA